MLVQAEIGPIDSCKAHRRSLAPSTPVHVLIRWGALLFIVLFMLALPFLYFEYRLWLHGTALRAAELAILGAMVAWLVGRPLAVLVSSRLQRAPPQRIEDHGVSVVVPCYNAGHKVEQTLQSLLAQTVRPIEIVFVENNSTDDTLDVLRRLEREHPEVRAFSVQTRPGEYPASVAVNYGVARATHDIIVRMDDDTLMQPDTVALAIPPLVRGDAVAVACNLRVANSTSSVWTRVQSLEYLLAMEMDRRSQVMGQTVLCCSGGLSVFRRDSVLRAGGFCSLPRWVSEDLDMTMKNHRLGLVAVRPQAVGFTTVPETLWQVIRQRYRWAISGTVAIYLHRFGLARRSYWFDGRVGFLGLPMRVVMGMRDLVAPLYPFYLLLVFARGGALWLGGILAAQMAVMIMQLLILMKALRFRQGLRYWFLIPFFTLVYGPVLLAVRFIGTWSGLIHIWMLRRKEEGLEHAGLDPSYARALELA
jgi:cellulose synthase/poly-beta-1,6-N-acetylglucosamine synthase-like glycosyltransferase